MPLLTPVMGPVTTRTPLGSVVLWYGTELRSASLGSIHGNGQPELLHLVRPRRPPVANENPLAGMVDLNPLPVGYRTVYAEHRRREDAARGWRDEMDPVVAKIAEQFQVVHGLLRDEVRTLVEELNWKPAPTNSIAVLVVHTLGSEAEVLRVAANVPGERDRHAEFRVTATDAEDLLREIDQADAYIEAMAPRITAEDSPLSVRAVTARPRPDCTGSSPTTATPASTWGISSSRSRSTPNPIGRANPNSDGRRHLGQQVL